MAQRDVIWATQNRWNGGHTSHAIEQDGISTRTLCGRKADGRPQSIAGWREVKPTAVDPSPCSVCYRKVYPKPAPSEHSPLVLMVGGPQPCLVNGCDRLAVILPEPGRPRVEHVEGPLPAGWRA